jgi:hypothetical protein
MEKINLKVFTIGMITITIIFIILALNLNPEKYGVYMALSDVVVVALWITGNIIFANKNKK